MGREGLALPVEWPSVSESGSQYWGWVLQRFHMRMPRNRHLAGKKSNDTRGKGKDMKEIIHIKMIVE